MDTEQIYQIAKQIDCSYEIGIWIELEEFLTNQEDVKKYSIKFEENIYILLVELKQCNFGIAKKLFHSLLNFIEYSSVFYTRKDYSNYMEYIILSSMSCGKGFMCHINIS